ncbi:type IV toxin-antitoxin system AbiEi family antitoxin domain-containing protein [uncultured Desulfosarcina sp.]|uniref:type IV toxin-antitoxin system AbiEi family antitoxin domain-containing protein n=1 Tax=uncultured Desulfosarcina sp. TaxID=218289 RepID=UPI0029C7EE35|nr:type IV toxin-antitoxin system AbiEi family antitoxin domain-containing protein [uncultured Desulfosarcina sp.]
MKDVQKELIAISTTLSSLVQQVEKMAEAIEKGSGKAAPRKKVKTARKTKTPAKKTNASAKTSKAARPKKTAKKKAAKKSAPATAQATPPAAAGGPTMLDNIFGMISRSRGGITVEQLKKRAGLEARQVSNALYKLTQKGKIETLSRGLYVKKK